MSKTLITYFSLTGNTRQVAEAIFDAVSGEKVLRPMPEVEDPNFYELIFAGFPVQSHSVPYAAEVFLKKIAAGRRVALFSTHGAVTGSRLSWEALEYASVLVAKAGLVGTFSCRGKVSMKALDVLRKSPEHEAWAGMAASAVTHPDTQDLEEARAFARWVMTVVAQERDGWR
jgi:flavodoxin